MEGTHPPSATGMGFSLGSHLFSGFDPSHTPPLHPTPTSYSQLGSSIWLCSWESEDNIFSALLPLSALHATGAFNSNVCAWAPSPPKIKSLLHPQWQKLLKTKDNTPTALTYRQANLWEGPGPSKDLSAHELAATPRGAFWLVPSTSPLLRGQTRLASRILLLLSDSDSSTVIFRIRAAPPRVHQQRLSSQLCHTVP